MTNEEIFRLLQECGFGTLADHPIMTESMMRFGSLVAAAEREACASVCDLEAAKLGQVSACSAAIRARSET